MGSPVDLELIGRREGPVTLLAPVRPLSGVDAAMAAQTSRRCEALPTQLAAVGFLSRVDPFVVSEFSR